MALGTDRNHGIRKVLNGTAPNPEAESDGIRADVIAAFAGEGSAFPTGASNLWRGRQFWRTDLGALYIYNGTTWVQSMVPTIANGQQLVGDAWNGVGAIQFRLGTSAVQASGTGSGNANVEFVPFPRGILFASVQLMQTVADTVKVRWRDDAPASTLGKLEMHLTTGGQNVGANTYHRVGYMLVGW